MTEKRFVRITQDVISVQACSSDGSKSLNVEQTHDKSGQLDKDTVAVRNAPEVHHEADTLNVDDEILRERMEKAIVAHDENHELMIMKETNMDFQIRGLPHSVVKHAQSTSARNSIRKIGSNANRHAFFNETDKKVNHSIT